MTKLILGSASKSRARILTGSGIHYEILTSSVDEDEILSIREQKVGALSPLRIAEFLAEAKAKNVASLDAASGGLVLGCDSVFELDEKPYGKPFVEEVAVDRWLLMRGRTGTLHTGHTLVDNRLDSSTYGNAISMNSSSKVTFSFPSEDQIRAYVATGEPLGCAGGFTIDGLAAAFIEKVEGDHNAVIGVSVNILGKLLKHFSVNIIDLWTPSRL